MGHLKVTIGHPRVTIGNLRATMGHLVDCRYRLSIIDIDCRLSISIVDYRYGLFSFLSLSKQKENATELHPKVRPTCPFYNRLIYVVEEVKLEHSRYKTQC